jgi:hypothetical protein
VDALVAFLDREAESTPSPWFPASGETALPVPA